MPFTIDCREDCVLAWTSTAAGATVEVIDDYAPTLRVQAHGDDATLAAIDDLLAPDPRVVDLRVEEWRPGFRHEPEPMLAVDVDRVDAVAAVAHRVRDHGPPGAYRCFDVDFSPQFRFCLERTVSPVPEAELTPLELRAEPLDLAEPPLTALTIDPEPPSATPGDASPSDPADGATARRVEGSPADVATAVDDALRAVDPGVLVLSAAELVPALTATADAAGVDLRLGRNPTDYGASERALPASLAEPPTWRQLARESTYESYGNVGHSPARYGVPGRAIVDRSNTFFYHEAGLPGCLDLVERSHKPLQELAWASIGNVLTAIQVRHARSEHDVLTPWNSWRHELPKRADQLHAADRGGHTLAPSVGVHERVHELDFQSLYPNIIRQFNVSPETVRCACHADRADVPGLDYAICEADGYLPEVLGPLIDDRAAAKAELPDCDDPARRARLEGRASAIKWILVSCFGYQGFSNAKFGRIECHEAINAYARELLLDAKERLEDGGWRLVHGIVDSLWVTAREDAEQEPLEELCAEITAASNDIPLEYEGAFEWIAFVPLRDADAGALTKYFGKRAGTEHAATDVASGAADAAPDGTSHVGDDAADGDRDAGFDERYKFRGIECRQRSTTAFVADAQRALIDAFDDSLGAGTDPASDEIEPAIEAVRRVLTEHLDRLETGRVDPRALLVRTSASKDVEEYDQYTRTVAALERARDAGLDPSPGQDVRFLVADDDADSRDRVRLDHEVDRDTAYDPSFYRDRLLRAAESVVSPLGWRREDVEDWLADRTDATLDAYG